MNFATSDFDYYERTIRIMYQNYFWKRIALASVALAIILLYTIVFQENMIVNAVLILALVVIIVYLFQQKQKFPEVYQEFLDKNEPEVQVYKVQEDEYSYNILDADEEPIRVNKKGVRNLPSNNKQFTMMVGFSKALFSEKPLQIFYYDILDLTYEEKFRLKRNGYSSMPRFLRRFTPANLKASAGNLLSFVIGNIFFLFIFFRLLRYVISIFQSLFLKVRSVTVDVALFFVGR